MKLPVTYLFVPGDRPERFDKAVASGADAVILDLEDAVAPADKDRARDEVGKWIASHRGSGVAHRRAHQRCRLGGVCRRPGIAVASRRRIAQCCPRRVRRAGRRVVAALPRGGRVLPLIETARGVQNVDAVAAANGVQRLAFGTLDYGVDLDLSGDERGLIYAGSRIALASRCAGIATPIAGVTRDARRRTAAAGRPGICPRTGLRRQAVHSSAAGCGNPQGAAADGRRDRLGAARAGRIRRARKARCRSTARWSTGRCCSRPRPFSIARRV